ncbi:MAG: S8 family peptidase [Cyanobacteriota bacterium]|nr:S8 family peptidase [Cyanobacteriota bacterium]
MPPTNGGSNHLNPNGVQARIQRTLIKTSIALPLLKKMEEAEQAESEREFDVIIDANLDYPGARAAAREWILQTLAYLIGQRLEEAPRLKYQKNKDQPHYVFARLSAAEIRALVELDGLRNDALEERMAADRAEHKPGARANLHIPPNIEPDGVKSDPHYWVPRAVYQIWEDFKVYPLIHATVATCKADAARAAFRAAGQDICWAVIDSGIDGSHPHFSSHANLKGTHAQWHRDFTDDANDQAQSALLDAYGHGTHVAGIIAGEIPEPPPRKGRGKAPASAFQNAEIRAYRRMLDPVAPAGRRETITTALPLSTIGGMAPHTRLVSLKVLDGNGIGDVSSIISALNWIQEINGYGRRIQIHGVNLSVGYPFDAEWFACGQSQLCVEVDRLVRSGVAVVVAAGNRGYGQLASTQLEENRMGGLALSISDPGNAELAITVGSTHREMPHVYGVSYFSGKGPTGDGRRKPDLLAPGEKILSCGTGRLLNDNLPADPDAAKPNYIEYSGTSMAAPHVSGCIASFLSVKREFIGRPDRVKEVFLATATDLGRERTFQGAGLVDLMRAIQHV